jgi:hypothetical protein
MRNKIVSTQVVVECEKRVNNEEEIREDELL